MDDQVVDFRDAANVDALTLLDGKWMIGGFEFNERRGLASAQRRRLALVLSSVGFGIGIRRVRLGIGSVTAVKGIEHGRAVKGSVVAAEAAVKRSRGSDSCEREKRRARKALCWKARRRHVGKICSMSAERAARLVHTDVATACRTRAEVHHSF